jgi:hypothetical protein
MRWRGEKEEEEKEKGKGKEKGEKSDSYVVDIWGRNDFDLWEKGGMFL